MSNNTTEKKLNIDFTPESDVPTSMAPQSTASPKINMVHPNRINGSEVESNRATEIVGELTYKKGNNDEVDGEYDQLSSTSFFLKHSYRDLGRKKFHFCLSFCSVFIVVWASLVINTLTEKGPIIFLKLAESLYGQFDGYLYPAQAVKGNNFADGVFLNYT